MEEMAENELLNKIADDFFIKQFKEIVDQQIEAQGFPELCKRTVIKELKDTVQKIQDEQLGIKRLIINSVSRYNNLLTSKKNERNPSREENSRVKSSSNASNNLVIVIDDEDDECVDFTTPKTSVSLTSSSTLSLIATSSCSTAPVEISLLSPLSPKDLPITDRVSKSPDIKIYNDSNERTVEHSNHDNSQVLAFSTNSCTTSTEKNSLLTSSSPTISQLTFLGADVARGSLKKCNNEPNICSLGTDVARDNLEKCNNEPNVCSLEKNSPNLENKSINNDLDSPNHEKLDLNNESFKTVHAMDNQDLTIYEPKSRSLRDEEREHTSVLSDDGRKEVSISDSQLLNSDLFNEEKSFNSEKDLHKKSDVESSPPSSPMLTKIISADSSPLPEASSADIETFSPDVFSAPSSQDVPSSPDSQILLRNKQKATSVKFNHRDHSLVYARPDKSDIWYQAEIIKELTPYRNERRFQVHFLSGQKVTQKILIRSVASIHSIDSSIVEIGSRIVAPRPSDTVNSAISKKYKDINNSAGVISVMFAGVVAEVACEQNKFRYLIFFDDGYAQYLPLKKLFPVVFVSKYVWSDVSTECRDFIKEYLQDYPYRPLLNAKIGCAMETEWNGSWWKSKVVSFDGSLIKILFDIDKRSEWVYKGTSRLEPLYKYFTNSANSKNKSKKNDWFIDEKITHPNFGICRYSLKDPKGYQQRLLWDVENQQGEYICQKKENDPKEANPLKLKLININSLKRSNSALSSSSDSSKNSHTEIKHSLKKRRVISDTEESSPERNTKNATLNQEAFSVSSVVEMSPLESTCSISTSSSIGNGMSPSTPLEPSAISSSDDISKKSVMSSNSVLSNTQEDDLKSSLHIHYVPHTCSCACIKDSRNYFDQHRLGIYNYLSIPFQLGWKRESSKKKVNYHRDIYYRAPCGKRMRNLSEVTKYLTQTECKNVCIDMFCFQSNVSCRNHTSKTKPALYRNEDISNGKEICPVVCVNEISTEPPPHVTYINYRIKADDVSINTDPGFLVCCDCTDNCQDKATCQCAKLTIESSNAIDGEIDKNSGYHFRRLKECIATGIYECNQNCACSPVTCYNRVVQNGIQLRLQVFLTENRGWGLRCVDDIPKGTFVCTYAGQVLNEQTANKEGIDFGDEYLAELDHIEVVEQAKEGYESDVPELSNHSIDDMSSEEWQSDSSYSVVLISSDSTDSSDNDDTHPAVKSKDKCENPVKKEQQVTCVETKSENTETSKVTEIRHVAKKSTGAKVHSYMSHRGKFFMTQRLDAAASNKTSKSSNHLSTRYLYQNDNQMFILDAKSYGNVGRYMNHSCNPNLFVQNVMVDTHDLRFPWVAFFTQHNITAYTELTWDYNYEVGSVPNKQISCKCGSKQCKGRLL